jgi:hypothetical protein
VSGQLAWPISSGPRTNPHNWVFFIKKPTLEADDMSPILFVLKKKSDDALFVLSRFQSLWWLENQAQDSFNPKTYFLTYFFLPKTHVNTLKTKINLFIALKNPKETPKNQTQPKTKNQPESRFVFSQTFKEQKHLI